MIIREECEEDKEAIYALTLEAFALMPFSNGTEAPIIDQLREDGDLLLSLVAEDEGDILGHIAFSPVTLNGISADWVGLGPVSVSLELQKQGIGGKLIKQGLSIMKERGAAGCALIGDPNYYKRFGFQSDGSLEYGDTPLAFVQWLSFGDDKASGRLKFVPAFERDY